MAIVHWILVLPLSFYLLVQSASPVFARDTAASGEHGHAADHGTLISWSPLTIAESFAQARELKKSIFVYYGATWCPPCNEMKSYVFNNPQIANDLKDYINIYLDGDSESAQQWAERLKISSYPSMLFLSPAGHEIIRIVGSVSRAEFQERLKLAENGQELSTLIDKALAKRGDRSDWRAIVSSEWPEPSSGDIEGLTAFGDKVATLYQMIPAQFKVEKSKLGVKLLTIGTKFSKNESDPNAIKVTRLIQDQAERIMGLVLSSRDVIQANSEAIVYRMPQYFEEYVEGKERSPNKLKWYRQYQRALRLIENSRMLNPGLRLMAVGESAKCSKILSKDQKFSPASKAKVLAEAEKLMRQATSDFDRQAVVTQVTDALAMINEVEKAREILLAELQSSKVPWYIYSNLASIEEEFGDKEAALKYYDLASQSAVGRTTKAQWLASNLAATIRLASATQGERIERLTDEFFTAILKLEDGFEGRNKSRLKLVKRETLKYFTPQRVKEIAGKYLPQCAAVREDMRGECVRYFSEY